MTESERIQEVLDANPGVQYFPDISNIEYHNYSSQLTPYSRKVMALSLVEPRGSFKDSNGKVVKWIDLHISDKEKLEAIGYDAIAEIQENKVEFLVSDDCRNVCMNVVVRWDGAVTIKPVEGISSVYVSDIDGIKRFGMLLEHLYHWAARLMPECSLSA